VRLDYTLVGSLVGHDEILPRLMTPLSTPVQNQPHLRWPTQAG
jgi:hypothetical protein